MHLTLGAFVVRAERCRIGTRGIRTGWTADSNEDSNVGSQRLPPTHWGITSHLEYRRRAGGPLRLKSGRSAVRPRPWPPPLTCADVRLS